ncbi:MAG: hypothetical protein V4710_18380 [Verrucomicrobiota bacterium]
MIATGAVFIFVGCVIVLSGEEYGIGMMLVGAVPVLFTPIYVWWGGRLGAELRDGCLIVHHYFNDTVTHLEDPVSVSRGIDVTIIEGPNFRVVLDDCFFSDLAARDVLVQALVTRSTSDNHP